MTKRFTKLDEKFKSIDPRSSTNRRKRHWENCNNRHIIKLFKTSHKENIKSNREKRHITRGRTGCWDSSCQKQCRLGDRGSSIFKVPKGKKPSNLESLPQENRFQKHRWNKDVLRHTTAGWFHHWLTCTLRNVKESPSNGRPTIPDGWTEHHRGKHEVKQQWCLYMPTGTPETKADLELSYATGGDVKCYSYFGKHFGSFSKP